MTRARVPVAVLGATGTVGQKFVRLFADHPWFEIVAVGASSGSAGRLYREAARWRESSPLPPQVGALTVQECAPPLPGKIVFSALDAEVAGPIEQAFARAGVIVVTNTRTHRMDPDVPLLVPEVNADHVRSWNASGKRAAGPGRYWRTLTAPRPRSRWRWLRCIARSVSRRCSSRRCRRSRARLPGVPSLDIVGNVIPYIGGEEEKIERESRKILGTLVNGGPWSRRHSP